MAEVIRMPRMSDTMEEGVIVGWMKKEGDTVESGETLAEVETDKATMELDSYSDGILLHIAVKEGPVPINGVIAVIGEKGEDWKAAIAAAGGTAPPSETPAATETVAAPQVETASASPAVAVASSAADSARIKASPLAKSMAKKAGIDISTIRGTGDQGRIIKKDVEALLGGKTQPVAATVTAPKTAPAPAYQAPSAASASVGGFEDVPVSQMRKAIARNVVANKFTAPHFYLTAEIDMEKAIAARVQMNEIATTRISFNDLAVKAAAVALRQHPAINAAWLEDNKIRYNQDINIGVAVDTGDGLLIPVIRNSDQKSLSQINLEVRAYAGQAKEKKLNPQDMQGSTFTISNLGMFGIEEFTAIINRPNACILAVGAIIEKPVVKDGELAIGKRMKVTLSCDHRVVDGVGGAKFLKTFKSVLEDPIRMLV